MTDKELIDDTFVAMTELIMGRNFRLSLEWNIQYPPNLFNDLNSLLSIVAPTTP